MSKGYTDEPVKTKAGDLLDLDAYVKSLADFIKNCETPMTIAIQGDWGSGKTSLMNLIKEQIKDEVTTFWFNTWQYSQFEMQSYLAVTLINNLLEKIEGGTPVLETFWKVAKNVLGTASTIAVEKGAGLVLAEKWKDKFDQIMDSGKEITELKEKLQEIVDKNIKKSRKNRMAIFIDDLDRLVPERAVELLEIMKNFLDIPGCVFVLAIDYKVVIKGAQKKYGGEIRRKNWQELF